MQVDTDILVIGSGIAGLTFALKASEYAEVIIITKKDKAESNTNYAQGGIASVTDKSDSFQSHITDTMNCGAGLCHLDAVAQIVTRGPELIRELINFGVNFSRQKGKLELGREGGHSYSRIVHSKDLTGKEIENALLYKASRKKNIKLFEHHAAIELITEHHLNKRVYKKGNINCYGAYVLDEKSKKIFSINSKLTIVCTGGIGQIYRHTTNPSIATGDGIAMAFRSGAEIANMEFVQFHPTSLYETGRKKTDQAFLITEALRGAGAELKTKDCKTFMQKYDKRGSLAPRDIVARAIDFEMKKRGDEFVFLDTGKITKKILIKEFPTIVKKCQSIGLDIFHDKIPVVPSSHYICGGVVTDINGRTSVNNLFALGETAMTGVHGANRLASNSLLEALVYADEASKECKSVLASFKDIKIKIPKWDDSGTKNTEEWILISENKKEIKAIMSHYVGIVRSNLRLERAMRRVKFIMNETENFYKKTKVTTGLLELRNMVLIAYLIIHSAMLRKESRGLHYNTDYPETNSKLAKDTLINNSSF